MQGGATEPCTAPDLSTWVEQQAARVEELERKVAQFHASVPQTFGEVFQLLPGIEDACAPHEWDNRTTPENAAWAIAALIDYCRWFQIEKKHRREAELARDVAEAEITQLNGWVAHREQERDAAEERMGAAYRYAKQLCESMAKEWPAVADWKALSDLDGVLCQIDNMWVGFRDRLQERDSLAETIEQCQILLDHERTSSAPLVERVKGLVEERDGLARRLKGVTLCDCVTLNFCGPIKPKMLRRLCEHDLFADAACACGGSGVRVPA